MPNQFGLYSKKEMRQAEKRAKADCGMCNGTGRSTDNEHRSSAPVPCMCTDGGVYFRHEDMAWNKTKGRE